MVRNLVWTFSGVKEQLDCAQESEDYFSSAHVCRVIGRYKFDVIVGPSRLNNFLCVHEQFVHPTYVLRENVTLYTVDENEAVFIEVDECMKVWQSNYGTFMREVQFLHARKVITMPFSVFQRLAAEVGPPKCQVVFICNIARCGSVLVSRLFEESGRCLVMREADALNALAMYLETKPREIVREIARCVISLLCQLIGNSLQPMARVFKMTSGTMGACSLLAEVVPSCKIIFCYRNAKNAAISLEKLTHKSPLLEIMYFLSTRSEDAVTKVYLKLARLGSPRVPRCRHRLEYGIHRWIASIKQYEQIYSKLGNSVMAAVLYEDMVKDPLAFVDELFQFCQLPEELVPHALKAFDTDSQENSCLSKKELGQYKAYEFTPKLIAQCDEICIKAGLPLLEQECLVNGLIAHKNR